MISILNFAKSLCLKRQVRCIVLAFAAAALMSCTNGNETSTGNPPTDVATLGQVIALAPDAPTRDGLLEAAAARGYGFLSSADLPALGYTLLTFELPVDVTGAEAIDGLEGDVATSIVGFNHAYRTQVGSQPASDPRNYATALLGWPGGGCSAVAPIGLIDTAVDPSAPMLADVRIVARDFAETPSPGTRHGTELASVLADPSRLRDVVIYNANVVGSAAGADAAGTDALIRGIDWIVSQQVPVANIALAGPYNKLLDAAVTSATKQGLVIVAAVGNAGPDVPPQYPAAFDGVIAVTAVDANRQLFSNAVRGQHVDIAAPGVDIFVPNGANTRFVSGTSIATSFVTAWIAADAMLIAEPGNKLAQQRLQDASEDLGASGPDPLFGAGLLNAEGLCRD